MKEFPDFAEKRGWHLDKNGDYRNPKLGEMILVVICKDDGAPIWDQFIHNEPVGAISAPINKKGEVSLIIVERLIFKDKAEFPLQGFSQLGALSVECPRGFSFKGGKSQETAAREVEEEIGSPILESTFLGHIRANSSFNSHAIPIYLVKVDEDFAGRIPPDVNEKILKVKYYPLAEAENMAKEDKITRGITKAAICNFLCYLLLDQHK